MSIRNAAHRTRAGFTLIEVTIAITVMLVAVLSTYLSQITAHDLLRAARETNIATADAQALMERMSTRSVDQIVAAFPPGADLATGDAERLRDESLVASYPGFTAGGMAPDPLTIVIVVTWSDFKGRERSLRFASMKTR